MRLLFDDTSNRGSDAGYNPVDSADQQFFSDDQRQRFQGENYSAGDGAQQNSDYLPMNNVDGGAKSNRQSLIQKAKNNLNKFKNRDKGNDFKSPFSSSKKTRSKSFLPGGKNQVLKSNNSKNGKIEKAKQGLSMLKSLGGKGDSKEKTDKSDEKKESTVSKLKNAYDKISKGDPRSMVGEEADKYLHAGRRAGDILVLVWVIVTAILTIIFVVPGLIGIVMLYLLLKYPQLNYRITIWILEWALSWTGIGEAIATLNQFGTTKIKVEINDVEKYIIYAVYVIYFVVVVCAFALIITLGCWSIGGWGGTLVVWLDQTGVMSSLKNFCPSGLK